MGITIIPQKYFPGWAQCSCSEWPYPGFEFSAVDLIHTQGARCLVGKPAERKHRALQQTLGLPSGKLA